MNKRIRTGLITGTIVAGTLFGAGAVNAQVDDVPPTADTEQPADASEDAPEDGERGRRGRHGHRGARAEATAELLGIEVEDLRSALDEGQTLAEVATANGVDPQTIIDAKIAEKTDRINAAVEDGRLTVEEADEKRAELTERVTTRVNEPRPERGERGNRAATADADG